jgi:predicted MFS family arabinose efflux permease
MLKKLTQPYKGLSKEIWYLALITLVNRAGAMVIPFLSLYLTKYMGYSMGQVGWIMTSFGFGSVLGVWLGGKLTDIIGYYKVMVMSLFAAGLVLISLQFLNSFWLLCGGVFMLTLVADGFRPAIYVAVTAYSKPENQTRSITLIRLAINLGFSLGPALGGFLIANVSYAGLFWVDGITCIIAAIIMIKLLRPKKAVQKADSESEIKAAKLPYTDIPYLIFIGSMFLIGFTFLQYFATIPLFYNKVIGLDEQHIGWLMAMNGLLIFLFEMPLVGYYERHKTKAIKAMLQGMALLALSFLVLNTYNWVAIAILGMFFMTLGEMLAFPFSNTYAMNRSKRGKQGAYMALYSMSFSFAHILGPNIGLHIADKYGFNTTWYVMAGLMVISAILLYSVYKKMEN